MSESETRKRARALLENRRPKTIDEAFFLGYDLGVRDGASSLLTPDTVQSVLDAWNTVAERRGLPKTRPVDSNVSRAKRLLKEEPDVGILKEAMDLFARQDFIRENRYGFGNFVPNAVKYVERVYDERRRASHRQRADEVCREAISIRDLAAAAGMSESDYRQYHNIKE